MTDTARRPAAPVRITPLELRLYAIAGLAAIYLIAWRAITGGAWHDPAAAAAPAAPPSAARWLDEMPAAQRPAVVPPPGWRVVSRDPPAAVDPAPRVVRAPVSRPLRIRTRSS